MSHYPNTRGFTGTLRPVRLEGDILDVEIEGEVPSQLNGTFHRVHPDQQFPPKYDTDQFFNGDGMVTLFRFRNGVIDSSSVTCTRTSGSSSARPAAHCSVPTAIR